MPRVDLHIHTNLSDGDSSPEKLIDIAISSHLTHISICDHDTVSGIDRALNYAEGKEIVIIPGVELSIDFTQGDFHLLGLGIDHKNSSLENALATLKSERHERIKAITSALIKKGISVSYEDVLNVSMTDSPGKPHIAAVIAKKGYADSPDHAFKKFFSEGTPFDISKKKINVSKGIQLILAAGGIPVIAHPVSLNMDRFRTEKFIIETKELGLKGVEVYSNMHGKNDVEFFEKMTLKHNMLISGGSDYHNNKQHVLGEYGENRSIPDIEVSHFLRNVK